MKKSFSGLMLFMAMVCGLAAASKPQELPEFTGDGAENAVVVGTKGLYQWNLASSAGDFFYLDVANKTNEYKFINSRRLAEHGRSWEI